ncbi:hypothetical protein L2E82_45399 [Cichorium intybus]|uniref:Uncharacterized protein n=1 Tax=Cichorium intybus TaxID=13427 RepID=A0ACB8ZSS0_CICIN|nr:hypothetical protein L2E82_45399 [Cichorium intybus]
MTGLVTQKLEAFASRAKIVHIDIDIDSAEINKILEEKSEMKNLDFSSWKKELDEQKSTHPLTFKTFGHAIPTPIQVLDELTSGVDADDLDPPPPSPHISLTPISLTRNLIRHFDTAHLLLTIIWCCLNHPPSPLRHRTTKPPPLMHNYAGPRCVPSFPLIPFSNDSKPQTSVLVFNRRNTSLIAHAYDAKLM